MAETSQSNAGVAGLIPGQGAKVPGAVRLSIKNPNIKQKQWCNKFNKDFKKWSTSKKKKKSLLFSCQVVSDSLGPCEL